MKVSRIASYKHTSLMEEVFLQKYLRNQSFGTGFFQRCSKPLTTFKDAALAVKNGDADCMVATTVTLERLNATYPRIADALDTYYLREPTAQPALVGSRDR